MVSDTIIVMDKEDTAHIVRKVTVEEEVSETTEEDSTGIPISRGRSKISIAPITQISKDDPEVLAHFIETNHPPVLSTEISDHNHLFPEITIAPQHEHQLISQGCNVTDVESTDTGSQTVQKHHETTDLSDHHSSSKVLWDADADDQCSKEAIVAFQGRLISWEWIMNIQNENN